MSSLPAWLSLASSPRLHNIFHMATGCPYCGSASPAIYFCATCALAGENGPSASTVACNHCAGLSSSSSSPALGSSASARRNRANATVLAAAPCSAPPSSSSSLLCPHRGHALVRVRRAAYADAVLFSDAATFDVPASSCSAEKKVGTGEGNLANGNGTENNSKALLLLRNAQSYRINGHRVVMLRARQPPTAPPPSGNRCVSCGSGAADGHSACSLQCLLSGLGSGRIPSSSSSSASAFASEGCFYRNHPRNAPSSSRAGLPRHYRCSSPANSSTNQNRSYGDKESARDNGGSSGKRRPALPPQSSASAALQAPVTPPRTEARLPLPRPFPGDLLELGGGLPPLVLNKVGGGPNNNNNNNNNNSWEHSPTSSATANKDDLAAAVAQVQDHCMPLLPLLAPVSCSGERRKRPGAPLAGACPAAILRRLPSPPPSPPVQHQQQHQQLQRQRALLPRSGSGTPLSEAADAFHGATPFGFYSKQQKQLLNQQQQQQTARRGIPLYGRRRSASICSCPPVASSSAFFHKGAAAFQQLPVTLRPLNLRARDKKQGSPSRSALD